MDVFKFKFFKKNKMFFNKNVFKNIKLENSIIKNNHNSRFYKLVVFLKELYKLNYNIYILDFINDYNYLPISNKILKKKNQNFYKYLKYFNVKSILYLNTNKGLITKFFKFKLINVTTNKGICKNTFDFTVDIYNDVYSTYLLYLIILNTYLKNF